MLECSNCAQKYVPTTTDVTICPYCGHADGEGMLHLQEQATLDEADQFSPNSLIKTMGKLALFLLVVLVAAVLLYGYASIKDGEVTNASEQKLLLG